MDQLAPIFAEQEVAERFKVSLWTLQRWRRARKIGYVKYGRAFFYTQDHIDQFNRACEGQAATA